MFYSKFCTFTKKTKHIHNKIAFLVSEMGLTTLLDWFLFKRKIIEGSHLVKKIICFLTFGPFLSKCSFFEVVKFVFSLSTYLINSVFQW